MALRAPNFWDPSPFLAEIWKLQPAHRGFWTLSFCCCLVTFLHSLSNHLSIWLILHGNGMEWLNWSVSELVLLQRSADCTGCCCYHIHIALETSKALPCFTGRWSGCHENPRRSNTGTQIGGAFELGLISLLQWCSSGALSLFSALACVDSLQRKPSWGYYKDSCTSRYVHRFGPWISPSTGQFF